MDVYYTESPHVRVCHLCQTALRRCESPIGPVWKFIMLYMSDHGRAQYVCLACAKKTRDSMTDKINQMEKDN